MTNKTTSALRVSAYIDWKKEAIINIITRDQFNQLIDRFKKENWTFIQNVDGKKTKRNKWFNKTYAVDSSKKSYTSIYCRENFKYYIYTAGATDQLEEQLTETRKGGKWSKEKINKMMTERYGKTLATAFGELRNDEGHLMTIIQNLPQLIKCDQRVTGMRLSNMYKADFSSAFPHKICGKLPDAHQYRRKKGIVEPSESFPFAFYPTTGDMCIYGELDTRAWRTHKYYKNIGKWNELDSSAIEPYTILMRASKYELTEIMNELYDGRKDNPDNKLIMNCFIGYLRSTKYNMNALQPHLALVAYCRHIQAMLDVYDALLAEGNLPILFMTDSVLWLGKKPSKTVSYEKKFGAFVSEYENCDCVIYGCGIYAIEKNGELFLTKHQGVNDEDFKQASIECLKDFSNYYENKRIYLKVFDEDTCKFELKEVFKYHE